MKAAIPSVAVLLLLLLLAVVDAYPPPIPMLFPDCVSGPLSPFPICNPALPLPTRISDLLSRMNVTEKILWLGNSVPELPRVPLPAYQWWEEALHGLARSPGPTFDSLTPFATQFPQPLSSAQAFNRSLWQLTGAAISDEARAFSNVNRGGFDFWTPVVNIYRDPRWGRAREVPGEDPYLTSAYVRALVSGLQGGEDARYLKVLATCKHYTAYDMENSTGTDRVHFDAIVSDQDIAETFQPPFQACVEAGVHSVMCSYNKLNGVPMCANSYEMNDVLRGQWGFSGYITSDCGGIEHLYNGHHWVPDFVHTLPAGLRGGCDLDCGEIYQTYGVNATRMGILDEADVDRALSRAMTALARTGWFDPPAGQYYRQIGLEHINTAANQQLAQEAAEQAIVLLKNDAATLPLARPSSRNYRLAIVGPNANDSLALFVSYFGVPPFSITPVIGARLYGIEQVLYAKGCSVSDNDTSGFKAALAAVQDADAVLFVAGNGRDQENEAADRQSLELPGLQWALLQQIEKATSAPLVLVLYSSGPYDLTYARRSPRIGAIVSAGVPGQSGGIALMRMLYGDFSPAGRLTSTAYPAQYAQQIAMTDMRMRGGDGRPGRTYKFYDGPTVFPFGYGLSYSAFHYQWEDAGEPLQLTVDALLGSLTAETAPLLSYRVNVTNVGAVTAADSVLGFIVPSIDRALAPSPPLRALFSFDRVLLQPGESKQALLVVSLRSLLTVREDGSSWLLPGLYRLVAGVDSDPSLPPASARCERELRIGGEAREWSAGRRGAAEAYKKLRAARAATAGQ